MTTDSLNYRPMPFVTNHNHASGTFNNISGDQSNYNFSGAIVLFKPPDARTQTISTVVEADVSDRYRDVISHIMALSELIHGFMGQPFSPGYLLLSIEDEMKEFARIVVYAAKALDIIDKIPGRLKHIQPIKDASSFVRGFSARLRALCSDMQMYRSEVHPKSVPGFWRGLSLYTFSYFRWSQLSSEMGTFLEENGELLKRFLYLVTSRPWRNVVSDAHGKQLEQLVSEAGLNPDTNLYHIQMHKIMVRDHLGRNLPIPLELCNSWNDLGIIIKHFCHNVQGSELILRDDWELVRAIDSKVVNQSSFRSILQPETELEISVVLSMLASSLYTCPGCGYENASSHTADGWINCHKCDQYFRVVASIPKAAARRALVAHDSTEDTERTPLLKRDAPSLLKPILSFRRRAPPESSQDPADLDLEAGQEINPFHGAVVKDSEEALTSLISKLHRVSIRAGRIVPRPSKKKRRTPGLYAMHARPPPEARIGFTDNLAPAVLDGTLMLGKRIGSGGYAVVFRGQLQQGQSILPCVAVKISYVSDGDDIEHLRRRIIREARIIQGISHPNVLQFYGICTTGYDYATGAEMTRELPGLVSELCEGRSIMGYLKDHPKIKRVPLMFQAALGLEYLHDSCNIIHGDLKPDNIFIAQDGNNIKAVLADFGRSRVEDLRGFTTAIASSYVYTAPEVAVEMGTITSAVPSRNPDPVKGSILAKSSDIYSFGLSTLTIVSGRLPFNTRNALQSTMALIVHNERPTREQHACPEICDRLWELICDCWQVEPLDRPVIASVADTLYNILKSKAE